MKKYENPSLDVNNVNIEDILNISKVEGNANFNTWDVGEVEDFTNWGKN